MAPKGGMSTSTFSVEGVSWLEQVFEMMASRDPSGTLLSVTVPDTVAFRYQRPAGLYYTEDGYLRSLDDNAELNAEALLNRFSKGGTLDPDELCATYVYRDRQSSDKDRERGAANYVVEYMNTSQLHTFLNMRVKDNNGVLQRFIPCRSASNSSIRVMWTPRTCIVESCANNNRMDDPRLPMADKAPTFDGPPHLTTTHDISKGLFCHRIRSAVEGVVKHIESLLPRGYHVWEAITYWKFSAPTKGSNVEEGAGLTFKWTSCIRLYRDEVIDVRRIADFWATEARAEHVTSRPAPQRAKDILLCPMSSQPLSSGKGVEVQTDAVIVYLSSLARMQGAPKPEVAWYMQEAQEITEQARQGIDVFPQQRPDAGGGRGTEREEGQVIEDAVSALLKLDTKRYRKGAAEAARDRTCVGFCKRAVFARGIHSQLERARLSAVLKHPRFVGHQVTVCEEVALKVAQAAMTSVARGVHTGWNPEGALSKGAATKRRPVSAAAEGGGGGGGLTKCNVVEVKTISVIERERGASAGPRRKKEGARGSGAGDSAGGSHSARNEARVFGDAGQGGVGGMMALRRLRFAATATSAGISSASPSLTAKSAAVGAGGVAVGLGGSGGGVMGGPKARSQSARVQAKNGGGGAGGAVRPHSTRESGGRGASGGGARAKGGEDSARGSAGEGVQGKVGDGEGALDDVEQLFVEDEDEDEWDDGLEMDLPSTQRKLIKKPSPPVAGDMFLRAGHDRSLKLWSKGGKGAQDPLFVQLGQGERVRARVLSQYKAFGGGNPTGTLGTPGTSWGSHSPPRGTMRAPLRPGGDEFISFKGQGSPRGGASPKAELPRSGIPNMVDRSGLSSKSHRPKPSMGRPLPVEGL